MNKEIEGTQSKFVSYMIGERKSPYTVKQYSFLSKDFLNFVDKPLKNITPEDIDNYKSYLASVKHYSKNSQYLAIKAIKLLFKSQSVTAPINLTPPKRSKKMPNYLNERETKILIETSLGNNKESAIVQLLIYTGIRVGELCKLNIDDVDLEERVISIRSGKGDRDRIVIIPEESAEALSSYLKERYKITNNSKALFLSNKKGRFDTSTIERIIKRIAKSAGIHKKVTPHVLRHTFATTVLRNGGDIRFIQQILGHSSVATTQIYTHIDDNTLRDMYDRYAPHY